MSTKVYGYNLDGEPGVLLLGASVLCACLDPKIVLTMAQSFKKTSPKGHDFTSDLTYSSLHSRQFPQALTKGSLGRRPRRRLGCVPASQKMSQGFYHGLMTVVTSSWGSDNCQ